MAGLQLGIEEAERAEAGVSEAGGEGALAGARGTTDAQAQALGLGAMSRRIEARLAAHGVVPPHCYLVPSMARLFYYSTPMPTS